MNEQEFIEYLNDLYGTVSICGMEYPAGQALKDVDPTAFDVAFADYDSEYDGDDE